MSFEMRKCIVSSLVLILYRQILAALAGAFARMTYA